jgi:hypothetical protein
VASKLHGFIFSLIALIFGLASVLAVQAQTTAPSAATTTPAANAILRGHIADPTGALIPGAAVTITTSTGKPVATVTAGAGGGYQVTGLPAGSYIVRASYVGFAPFVSPAIQISAGQAKRVDIAMAMLVAQQSITVSEDTPTVSVDAGSNSDTVMLKGKDLDSLSDDPDELESELTALAGPSAGPNGGQIYIDGFSGGQLPPKSAIREIRINQNPFSAEFDRLGYGRIEVLIKPGADQLHGQFFVQGNDNVFNTGNPFTKDIPPYHSYQFNGTVSGPLTKNASYSVSAEQRNTQSVNAWSIPNAVFADSTGLYTDYANYGVNLLNRRTRDNASARVDWQLGSRNTFTARYGFWSESEHGDLSTSSLTSASTHESDTDHTLQISDAIVINDHLVNESRFQYEREYETLYPDSTARTISVQGDFSAGGYTGQKSVDHSTNLEFQNLTTLTHGPHAIKFGTRMRDTRDANETNSNFNGKFTFGSYQSYLAMANGLAAGTPFSTLVAAGYGPASASYTAGDKSALANVFDLALFLQDDWKVNSRLTLSGGIRWEAQNHVKDHNDWAPRAAIAYALDGGNNKKAKTVLRGGYGFFYDRFKSSNLLSIYRSNLQNHIILNSPTCTGTGTSLDAIDMSTCFSTDGTSTASVPVRYEVAKNYHSPYTQQVSAGVERQLTNGISTSLTYMHSFGVHQQVTRNANQAIGGTPQTTSGGYLYEYYPEAVFKQNQLIASVNATITRRMSVMSFYTLSYANSNGNGSASNAYNLDADYGRAGFVARNMLFVMGNYTAPWMIRFNPFLIAQSGRPYNITLPTDSLNNFYNQRPTYATSDTPAANQVTTAFGVLDYTGLTGKAIPVNLGNGPAAVAFNMRISKAIGLGPKLASAMPQDSGPGGPGGGAPPPPPPGGGHGGGPRGGPGGPMGAGMNTGHKYSLTFSAQALNLFNNINKGTPNGTVIPTLDASTGLYGPGSQFGVSNSMAGGIFSQGSAARRIFLQAVLSF